MQFPTSFESILARIELVNPLKYASTRNYVDGSVSYLSPYISRGVISVNDVKKQILKQYSATQSEKFLQELAWREYWQRVWQSKGDFILQDLKHPQQQVQHKQMIKNIAEAATGIEALDKNIELMFDTGYMHNHVRMYVASLSCNIGAAHWLQPARWMYYHLLDGDIASNHLSWQWVAGSFSSKKYYCNQENINKFTGDNQQKSFLDFSYEHIERMPVPESLVEKDKNFLNTLLPQTSLPLFDTSKPVLLYNSYQLDPLWRKDEEANRVLLLEPSLFKKFPVSEKVIDFVISLSKNIESIQLFCGEMQELENEYPHLHFISKEHPAFSHYPGIKDSRDWMFPQVEGYYPSFFSYWKKCAKFL
jgi:deoxyribodipyrimidine photo-lyase